MSTGDSVSRLRALKVDARYESVVVAGQGALPGAPLVPASVRGFMSGTSGAITYGNATSTSNMWLLVRGTNVVPGASYVSCVFGPALVDWANAMTTNTHLVTSQDVATLSLSVRGAQQFYVMTQRHAKLEALFKHAKASKWQRRALAAVLQVMLTTAMPLPSAVIPQGVYLEDHWGGTQWSDGRGTSEAGITSAAVSGIVEFADLYTSQPGQKAHAVIHPAAGATVYAHENLLSPQRPGDVALLVAIGELALNDLFRVQLEGCGLDQDAIDACVSELLADGYLDVLYPVCGLVMPGSEYKGVPERNNPLITVDYHLPGKAM